MLEKFKNFWNKFWYALKSAYNQAYKRLVKSEVQNWRDISSINFLDIFVKRLNNLTNEEATFDIVSDSTQTERLKSLCKDLEKKRRDITGGMLGDGDYYVFPATNYKGEIAHTYLTQEHVRILGMDGDDITDAYGIIDWYIDNDKHCYYLLRHHELNNKGTLVISYTVVDNLFRSASLDKWEDINGKAYQFTGANHIGFGRYKSPADSRGLSPVYGVPLNFGCDEIETKIRKDLKLIDGEFENGRSVIFTDPRNLLKKSETGAYKLADNIIPIQQRAGQSGANIDIFNPNLRFSEHYDKLVSDLELYEKQVGTSKGILTENTITANATATEVKRANADTIALIDSIRVAMDDGNKMTLQADAVYLNILPDLWTYVSDWYDPFEDPAEQWGRLLQATNAGAAEKADLVRWIFPRLNADEIDEKLKRISDEQKINADNAVERILQGQ